MMRFFETVGKTRGNIKADLSLHQTWTYQFLTHQKRRHCAIASTNSYPVRFFEQFLKHLAEFLVIGRLSRERLK
jgi:hypothetical protein